MLLGSAGLMRKSLLRVLSSDPGYRAEGAVGLELCHRRAGTRRGPGGHPQGEGAGGGRVPPGLSGVTQVNRMPAPATPAGAASWATERRAPRSRARRVLPEVEPGYLPRSASRCSAAVTRSGGPARGGAGGHRGSHAPAADFPRRGAIGRSIGLVSSDVPLTIVGVVADQPLGGLDEARPPILCTPDAQALSPRWAMLMPLAWPGNRRGSPASGPRRGARPRGRPGAQLDDVLQQAPTMFLAGLHRSSSGCLPPWRWCWPAWASSAWCPSASFSAPRVRRPDGGGRRPCRHRAAGARGEQRTRPRRRGRGLVGSVALATVFRGLLFGVASADPLVLGAVVALLGGVAVVGAPLPAARPPGGNEPWRFARSERLSSPARAIPEAGSRGRASRRASAGRCPRRCGVGLAPARSGGTPMQRDGTQGERAGSEEGGPLSGLARDIATPCGGSGVPRGSPPPRSARSRWASARPAPSSAWSRPCS